MIQSWFSRVLLPFGPQSDRAIEDEIQSHIQLHADELIAAGQAPEVAHRNARLRLGGVAQIADRCREQRRFAGLRAGGRNLHLTMRRLARDRSFSIAAVLMLALGIGATSAIFSVAQTALASPLPYPDPDRRVQIFSRWDAFRKTSVADQEIWDYRAMARTLSAVAAWFPVQQNLTASGHPARLTVGRVTANTFDVLGVAPLHGRVFTSEEDLPQGPPVAVLGYDLWHARFNADPHVVGRKIVLDDVAVEVVGVMPEGFRLPTDYTDDVVDPTQLWRPAQIDDKTLSRSHSYNAAAVLAPGQTVRSASNELAGIARQLTERGEYRASMHFTAFASSFDDEIRGSVRPVIWLLTGGVVCLLLIACANVGNLLLVRGDARQREFALRAALGASQRRLLRDLLLEALVLAVAGAATGLPLALLALAVVRTFDPDALQALGAIRMHWPMVMLSIVVATLTTVMFGAVPVIGQSGAFRISRDAAVTATTARSRSRLRRMLVFVEIAVATILLVTAGLMIRSLEAMRHVNLGFTPENVLTMKLALPQGRYPTPEHVVDFYRRVSERARVLPGVKAAGVVRLLPLASTIGDWGLDIDGYDESLGNAKGEWQIVTDGAFEALGTRLVRGRWFGSTDRTDTELVAVVNETLARTYWRSADDVIGGRLRLGSNPNRPWVRVVGIVADERHNAITESTKERFYIPHSQWHVVTGGALVRTASVVVRTSTDPMSVALPLEKLVQELDPDLPVGTPLPMTTIVDRALATPSLTSFMLASFAIVALILAAAGIYGVLAYVVTRRTREIGIRLALGSERSRVIGLVVRQGLGVAVLGVAGGAIVALGVARVIRSLLYGVEPTDALTFGAVSLLLVSVALAASALPAWRASQLSPLVALKTN